jgi:hypothetical protein
MKKELHRGQLQHNKGTESCSNNTKGFGRAEVGIKGFIDVSPRNTPKAVGNKGIKVEAKQSNL